MNTNTVVEDIDGLVVNLTGEEFKDRIRNVRLYTVKWQLVGKSCCKIIVYNVHIFTPHQITLTTLRNLEGYIDSFLNHTASLVSS